MLALDEYCPKIVQDKKFLQKCYKYSKTVADLAKQVEKDHRDILLGDYIEELCLWAIPVKEIGAFLTHCFN